MEATAYRAVVQGGRSYGTKTMENLVEFSSYRQAAGRFTSSAFSIKYVLSGTETYCINGRTIDVKAGHFLLTNAPEGDIRIDSRAPVNGICLDLDFSLLRDACVPLDCPDGAAGFPGCGDWWRSDACGELLGHAGNAALGANLNHTGGTGPGASLNHTGSSALGASLSRLGRMINSDPFTAHSFDTAFFATIAAQLAAELLPAYTRARSLSPVKASTRMELLHRLQIGKALLDDCFISGISLEEVSREAALSLFHFLRLFKTVYGITPHQYLISRRLEYARAQLLQHDRPVTDIALSAGFPDLQSFSKSFRKAFGLSPQKFRAEAI